MSVRSAARRLATLLAICLAAVLATQAGAEILRVHDVAATVDGLRVLQALGPERQGGG